MNAIVIGARILDVLTTGMYPDALDAIREYIQNSFDAIRRAEQAQVLKPNFGEVTVTIDPDKREVAIRDNGIGIPAADARSTLLSIGASKKRVGDDAGFRGIGRLAGLAYCEKLIFSTASNGEPLETELTFDAAAIRRAIAPTSVDDAEETAADLLARATIHKELDRKPGPSFFEVKLIAVDPKACPFLNLDEVRPYLRQVAPVEFNMQAFVYGNSKINMFLEQHNSRKTINLTLTHIGRQEAIKKPYKTFHEAGNKADRRIDIVDIETFVDPSVPPRWVAWLSKARDLPGVINSDEVRGIRLRSSNIQIGDERTFSRVFEKISKSYARFNGWFSGEVHMLDHTIIPNSRRDFFEDNDAWREAEKTLIEWARPLAKRVYQSSNERNRDAKLIEQEASQFIDDFQAETAKGFASDSLRAKTIQDIQDQEDRLEKALTATRTPEETETLRRKKEEIAALREKTAKPRSLIDESELSRDERKILRLAMDAVSSVCGDDLAKKTAEEINKRLRAKSRKKAAPGPIASIDNPAAEPRGSTNSP